MTKDGRKRAVDVLKQFQSSKGGDLALMSSTSIAKVPTISSGIYSLNSVLSGHPFGGYAQGRIVELFGPPGGGKTTTTLHALAATQARGGVAAFIDAEHALDTHYASTLGVDVGSLLISQPDCGEDALETAVGLASLLESGDLIVIDSVAALVPRAELEGEMGDSHPAARARLMSQAMRKLSGVLAKRGVTALFINQIISRLMTMMGANTETPGGKALKFFATQRIEVTAIGKIKSGAASALTGPPTPGNSQQDIIGNKLRYKIVKNKIFPPFRQRETELLFGQGVLPEIDLLSLAVEIGVVQKKGSWLAFEEGNIGQGMYQAASALRENRELFSWIEKEVVSRYDQQKEPDRVSQV